MSLITTFIAIVVILIKIIINCKKKNFLVLLIKINKKFLNKFQWNVQIKMLNRKKNYLDLSKRMSKNFRVKFSWTTIKNNQTRIYYLIFAKMLVQI